MLACKGRGRRCDKKRIPQLMGQDGMEGSPEQEKKRQEKGRGSAKGKIKN